MKFLNFLNESLLLEGGAALKGVSRITQVEARHSIPEIIKKVSAATGVHENLIRRVGSAGKKPSDHDTSGDIDIAIECSPATAQKAISELSHDGETFRSMKGINVYSFGYKINGKIVQVDLMPVEDIEYAEWSYASDPSDLKKGLKGAHRNELLFAVTKHAHQKKIKNEKGDVVEIERLFYDLGKGLMRGKQSRVTAKGKLSKNFNTVGEKVIVSSKPDEIAKVLFGDKCSGGKLLTFDQVYKAINGEDFPHKKSRDEILTMAKEGIKNKGLSMPEQLRS